MAEAARIFRHRLNLDGDFDSVCPDCLLTISSEPLEINLRALEINHHCDAALLNLLWGQKRFLQ
jgi:hypothetical protein